MTVKDNSKHKPGTDPKPDKGNDSKGHKKGLKGPGGTNHSIMLKISNVSIQE